MATFKERLVAYTHGIQDFVARLAHDFRPRVVIFINTVAKTHQPEGVVLVLGARDEFRNPVNRADFLQHIERCLVCAAMRRPPQRGNPRGDTRKRIGARGAGEANRRRRRVLLVVHMENENLVQRINKHRIDFIFLCGNRESTCA